ncbi:MBL fold metallo-hydrolase [Pleionea litopenaei]|uniref:MBL fold metallo-hydrolase n=1 Tax=Pleionea litopenaei TaxID=3070815 RepID=A0AA51X723_9GAMM|nr:MBL fold metallo-hydrolase [Pleionea sp. HL-JVS1]WMS87446.1 MBL fold metallo-hydrolase [Pleionea sp. HL-JVS1]
MFRCSSLGSGSKGNATLVQSSDTCLLVDCGFGLKDTQKRLETKGITPDQIDAILVTHEHGDHSSGVARLSRRFGIPVWLTRGTALHRHCEKIEDARILTAESPLNIGSIQVFPFTVPHDAREPVQFLFSHQQRHLGLVTDTGHFTQHMLEVLSPSTTLMLEFNHCRERLRNSSYPYSLQQRVGGQHGHLCNDQSLDVLLSDAITNLETVVALHLSEENNCPALVDELVKNIGFTKNFLIANQAEGCDWVDV